VDRSSLINGEKDGEIYQLRNDVKEENREFSMQFPLYQQGRQYRLQDGVGDPHSELHLWTHGFGTKSLPAGGGSLLFAFSP
jgi:hypothetical protein